MKADESRRERTRVKRKRFFELASSKRGLYVSIARYEHTSEFEENLKVLPSSPQTHSRVHQTVLAMTDEQLTCPAVA